MGVIETRTFKSGNSVAVRLPRSLGLPAGTPVILEQVGDTVTLRPATDPAAAKAKLDRMIARLREVGPILPIEEREPIEFPDRPGL